MGITRGPKTVTNGLVIHIDAANEKSFVSGSTLSYGLSNTIFTGSFGADVGSQTENSNITVFTHNGDVGSAINFGTGADIFPYDEFTFEISFKSMGFDGTTSVDPSLFGFTFGVQVRLDSSAGRVRIGLDPGFGSANLDYITNEYIDKNWHILQWRNDGFSSSLYVDNESVLGPFAQPWSGSSQWPTNGLNIGRDNNAGTYYLTGSIGHFKFYTRYLSEEELSTNFNAVRRRFGL